MRSRVYNVWFGANEADGRHTRPYETVGGGRHRLHCRSQRLLVSIRPPYSAREGNGEAADTPSSFSPDARLCSDVRTERR